MKKYVYKPYNNSFPKLFEAEKKRILSHLTTTLAIEHIGSTAVPGLGGKGIIDIAIAVRKNEMEDTIKPLQSLGYEFRPTFSTNERLYFVIFLPDLDDGVRRYHIHLSHLESNDWKNLIGFRDYLIAHPEKADEYAEIKKKSCY